MADVVGVRRPGITASAGWDRACSRSSALRISSTLWHDQYEAYPESQTYLTNGACGTGVGPRGPYSEMHAVPVRQQAGQVDCSDSQAGSPTPSLVGRMTVTTQEGLIGFDLGR